MANPIPKKIFPKGSLNKVSTLSLCFALVIVTLLSIGGFGIWSVQKQMKENLSEQLELVLSANIEALRIWTEGIKLDAEVLVSQPEIHSSLISLLEMSQSKAINPDVLRHSIQLTWIKANLGMACQKYGFVGYVIFDDTAMVVGSLLEKSIGTRELGHHFDFFYRSLQGDTVVTQPFPGEIDLPDENGVFHANWPTMFVSTPIRDDSGDVVGVLAFRLRPEKDFTHIFSVSRFGDTGETYAFNDQGVFVSNSRFDNQLVSIGLLQAEENAIFNIQIRDPGRNLTIKKLLPGEDFSQWPLTVMAQNAIQQKDGIQVNGYNDYRGVPVVGAWTWISELDIGLTTEVDVAEAFRPLRTLMTWFLFLFGLLILIGGLALILRSRYAQSQKQTLENERRLSSFLSSASDSIISIDTFGEILSVNPAVEKDFGYTPSELMGNNITMLMPKPYHDKHGSYLQAYRETGVQHIINSVVEVTAKRKDGTTFAMELCVSESVVNGIKSFLGIIRDISDRKESEKELQHAYAKLEERIEERTKELWRSKNLAGKNDRAKSEFLSRMSHELRTPMNAILGFAQLMKESTKDPLPTTHQNRTNQILKAGTHLLDLINEVLDLASIEAGKITVSLEPVCLGDLVEEVITVVRPLSQNFKIELINRIPNNEKVFVMADKTRFKQVLLNLVSNGIKYNRKGGTVTLSASLQNNSSIRIDIVDTGMGIPKDKINQLFDPFNRLGAENSEIEGTGIGMTISKKLIEVMHGTIGVESTPGEGSTFFVSLPVICPWPRIVQLESVPAENNETSDRKETSLFTLLYIEDNPANLRLVEDILSEYPEIKLVSETHAKPGIDLAVALKPNLILMDINLPDIDGIEALKRLRNFEETHEIPVIAISANAMERDINRAMAEGFKAYITKPIDIRTFRKHIEDELKSATFF